MTDALQVITTFGNRTDADALASELVDRRLAACVQVVGPVTSTFRWEGRIETAEEWLCLIKTHRDRYGELERAIQAVHPYDVPEILALPVQAGAAAYLAWLARETTPDAPSDAGPVVGGDGT
jgi:periplasmic divalent cation tolerance protein